jgi:hypothetical protein
VKERFDPVRGLPLLLASAAVLLGLYARLDGFGRWPISYDEFFIAKSVRNILAYGVPKIGEHGLYVRGLLVQYFAAGARLLGMGEEGAIRLLPLLANLSCLPAIWLLGRRVSGRAAACAAVAFFALSAWEIEFARFGRMYAPIQAVTLWFAVVLRSVVVDGREDRRKWLAALAALSIPVHESSIFLALALFLPDLLAWRKPPVVHSVVAVALVAAAIFWNGNDFRRFSPAPPPTGAARVVATVGSAGGKAILPGPMFKVLKERPWGALPVGLAALGGAVLLGRAFRKRGGVPEGAPRALLAASWLLGLLHAFAALPVIWAVGAMNGFFGAPGRDRRRVAAAVAGIGALFLAGWGIYAAGIVTDPAARLAASPARVASRMLFSWPDFDGRIVPIWLTALPRFLAAALAASIAGLVAGRSLPPDRARGLGLLATFFLFLLSLSAVVRTPYVSTRYTFPLMPFILLFAAAGLSAVARAVAPGPRPRALALVALCALFLLVSEDTRADRLLRPGSARTNFRMDDTLGETHHYVPRFDFRSPAAFVEANRRPGDRVVLTLLQPAFYLARPADGFFIRKGSSEFFNHFDGGTGRERWTGIPVLQDEASMRSVLEAPGTTWLIAGAAEFPFDRDLHRSLAQAFSAGRVFRSVDGKVVVYRVAGGVR